MVRGGRDSERSHRERSERERERVCERERSEGEEWEQAEEWSSRWRETVRAELFCFSLVSFCPHLAAGC